MTGLFAPRSAPIPPGGLGPAFVTEAARRADEIRLSALVPVWPPVCAACRAPAHFGFRVDVPRGNPGTWYCGPHKGLGG